MGLLMGSSRLQTLWTTSPLKFCNGGSLSWIISTLHLQFSLAGISWYWLIQHPSWFVTQILPPEHHAIDFHSSFPRSTPFKDFLEPWQKFLCLWNVFILYDYKPPGLFCYVLLPVFNIIWLPFCKSYHGFFVYWL